MGIDMNAATLALIEQIGSFLFQAVEAGIKYGPAIISDLRLAFSLATSGTALTPEQIASAELALQSAHAALQAQIAADASFDVVAS
jgi:hypothetical protein